MHSISGRDAALRSTRTLDASKAGVVVVDNDDGIRPAKGVVVSLRDLGDGTSRIIMDDVSSEAPKRETSWRHEWFYTHKRIDSKLIDDMALSDDQFRDIGIALVARLLALNGRAK